MKNFEKYLTFAKGLTAGENARFKNQAELAKFTGIAASQAKKYSTAEDMKNIEKFFLFLDKLGVELNFNSQAAGETARDVCWVNAKIMPAGEHVAPEQN